MHISLIAWLLHPACNVTWSILHKACISWDRHGHPRRLRREDVSVSGDFPVQLATSRTCTTILADLFDTRIIDARVYTCKCVLYAISYHVHVYKITR